MYHVILHNVDKVITFEEYPPHGWFDFVKNGLDSDSINKTPFFTFLEGLLPYFKNGYVFIVDEHWEGYDIDFYLKHYENTRWSFFDSLDTFKQEYDIKHEFFKIISGNLYYYFYEKNEYYHSCLHWIMSYNQNTSIPINSKDIRYRFCYLNRVPKINRVYLYDKIIKNSDILNNSIWSWNSVGFKTYSGKKEFHISKALEDSFIDIGDEDALMNGTETAIRKSYIQIVIESETYKTSLSFTEKIVKAIAAKKPFIVLASERFLEVLRKLGFKTFNNFWNEDYDLESDFIKRVDSIFNTLQYVNSMNIDDFTKMFYSSKMKKILEHNYTRLNELSNKTSYHTIDKPNWQKNEVKTLFYTSEKFKRLQKMFSTDYDFELEKNKDVSLFSIKSKLI